MKKYLLSLLALVLGIGMAQANPVSVSQAKYVGQQFVQANFDVTRQSAELTLVYTGSTMRGEACYYIFNVGNEGFVIVSADDDFRPVIGYSEESSFDSDNIAPAFNYYLNMVAESRSGQHNVADPTVAAEWQSVTKSGRLVSFNTASGSSTDDRIDLAVTGITARSAGTTLRILSTAPAASMAASGSVFPVNKECVQCPAYKRYRSYRRSTRCNQDRKRPLPVYKLK